MKTLSDYMNDPEVAHLPMPLREVKAIRLMIYDEIKGMTPSEITSYYQKNFEDMQRRHGFTFK